MRRLNLKAIPSGSKTTWQQENIMKYLKIHSTHSDRHIYYSSHYLTQVNWQMASKPIPVVSSHFNSVT